MLHAYIDESEFGTESFTLAALIIEEQSAKILEKELHALVLQYALSTPYVPLGAELHGYDIMQQQAEWSNIPVRMASTFYLKALGIINTYASALYVETIDRDAQARKYKNPWNPRSIAISFILERVNDHAKRCSETVRCFLDDHYTAPEGRKEFIQYKAKGTFGYKSSKLAHINELDFYDSKLYRGLQAADLCCYIYHRNKNVTSGSPKMLKMQKKMWGAISDIAAAGHQRTWP